MEVGQVREKGYEWIWLCVGSWAWWREVEWPLKYGHRCTHDEYVQRVVEMNSIMIRFGIQI